jgi:hypothetical protein
MASKTVAICEQHWLEEEGRREPFRVSDPESWDLEHCYRCGCPLTIAFGVIYVRRDVQ